MENKLTYDTKTQSKINFAKSNCIDYRIIIDDNEYIKSDKKRTQLIIVVTKKGRFVRTFYV